MTPETSIRLSLRDEAGHLHYLTSSEILYVKASNQWCHIVTAFDQFLSFGSLTSFEEKLPGFLRIHRSYWSTARPSRSFASTGCIFGITRSSP